MVNISHYLKAPYSDYAMGPVSYNCWGLVREVLYKMGFPLLPSHDDVHPDNKEELTLRYSDVVSSFSEVESPEVGDVMAVYRGVKMVHVGVCIEVDGRLMVLHTSREHGSRLDRLKMVKRAFPVIKWFRYADA